MEISKYNKPKSINIVNKETKIIKEFKNVDEFSDYLLSLKPELFDNTFDLYNESIYGLSTRIWFSKGQLINSELFTDKTFSLNLKENK
tara:strand:+ start:652 stop:915 length:264 start_codon:yes stop_codon:yes gene_type:complete